MSNNIFWIRFAELCEREGAKPNQIGKIIGLPSANLTNWKQGRKPSADRVNQIAQYFNVTPEYLLGYEINACAPERAELHKLVDSLPLDKIVEAENYIKYLINRN